MQYPTLGMPLGLQRRPITTTHLPALLLTTAADLCCICPRVFVNSCVEPYMPTHNANLLQFSAMMSGELKEAEALAHKMVTYPQLFGPNNMADGEIAADTVHDR